MAVCTAHKLQIPVGFVDKEEDCRSIHDMLTSEAAFIGSESVTGETDGGARHAMRFDMSSRMSAMGGKRTLGLTPLDNGLVVFRGVGLRDTALSAAPLARRVRRAFNHPGWVSIGVGNAGDFANKSAKHQQVTIAFCEGSPRIRNSIPVC